MAGLWRDRGLPLAGMGGYHGGSGGPPPTRKGGAYASSPIPGGAAAGPGYLPPFCSSSYSISRGIAKIRGQRMKQERIATVEVEIRGLPEWFRQEVHGKPLARYVKSVIAMRHMWDSPVIRVAYPGGAGRSSAIAYNRQGAPILKDELDISTLLLNVFLDTVNPFDSVEIKGRLSHKALEMLRDNLTAFVGEVGRAQAELYQMGEDTTELYEMEVVAREIMAFLVGVEPVRGPKL